MEHRKTAIRLFGRGLAGIGTALAYGVLGVLLYTGAMPLAWPEQRPCHAYREHGRVDHGLCR